MWGAGANSHSSRRRCELALAGRGGLVLLTGEPGIGKTALAREFVEHASARGAAWVWGSCWDGGGAPAYWPWVQVGRALSRRADLGALRDALGESAPWVARLLPELAGTLGAPAQPSELDTDQARFRLFDALATLLAVVAEQRPLVVVLDDLHWADASSLLALEFVARALPDIPLLAIAAYRHAEAHARAELAAPLGGLARAATRLPLEGLGRDDVGVLAAARARGLGAVEREPIPPQLVTAVHQASAGNPFFVDELVQLLASQGRLHDSRAAERPLPLPDGVRDAIRRRLAPLQPPAMEALSAAAVIGGKFGLHTLASVLDEPAGAVLERLDMPLRTGIVNAAPEAARFAFAHALVRDTLLEDLGATRRARLHRVAAEALEHDYRDDLEPHLAEIAHHFLHAATEGGAERAVDYAARAAQRAVGQFAYEEAARLYERAIDVAASLPADEPRAWQLNQGLGEARMRAGDVDGAQHALRAAAEHARRLDDPERLAQTALASTLGAFSPGLVEPELVATLEEALARLDPLVPAESLRRATVDALRCRLRVQLALALYWSPQRERREQLVDEALAIARALYTGNAARGSPAHRVLGDRTLAFALAQGFVAVWGPETVTRGLPISIEALELCERTSDAELGMQVRLWRISLLLELDDPVRADEEIEAFGSTARRLGQPRMLVYDPLHRAMAAHLRGDFAAAERFTAEAVAQSRDVPGSIAPIIADSQTFLVRRTQGRHLDLEPLVRKNADRLPAMRRWRCGLALVLAELGREDEARRELEHLAAVDFEDVPRDALWLVAMSLLAELCTLLHDRRAGAPPVRAARPLRRPQRRLDGRRVPRPRRPLPRPAGDDDRRGRARARSPRDRALGGGADGRAPDGRADGAGCRRGARAARRAGRRAARARARAARRAGRRADADGRRDRARRRPARAPRGGSRPGAVQRRAARPVHARLRRQQDVWLLDYDGRRLCLQDAKGMHHLAALFATPGNADRRPRAGGGHRRREPGRGRRARRLPRACAGAAGGARGGAVVQRPRAGRARPRATRGARGRHGRIRRHGERRRRAGAHQRHPCDQVGDGADRRARAGARPPAARNGAHRSAVRL